LQLTGGSAAQSTTLQVMDAALGVVHDGGKYLIAITCTRIRYSFILHMVYKNVIL